MPFSISVKKSIGNYLPLLTLLCVSGNPIVTSLPYFKPLLAVYSVFFIAFTATVVMNLKLHKSIFNYLLVLISFIGILVFLRFEILGFISYKGILGFILNILLGLFTLLYYKKKNIDFLDVYIKLMAFIALISIPFWLINQVGFYGITLPGDIKKTFILYTSFPHSHFYQFIRNSGMFWEPGAFAGYLIIGLIFVIWQNKAFRISGYKKETLLIVVGILTSMSTTGYVVFGILISMYAIKSFKWGKVVALPVIALIIFWGYNNLPFMQKKIMGQYTSAMQIEAGDVSNTRFGALLMDWQYITARPFVGNGLNRKTRYRFHPGLIQSPGFGNGMADFIADWGFLLFLWWCYCIYRVALKRTKSVFISCSTLFLIILVLQGEQFLNFPTFLTFFTLPFVYRKDY